jgi:hypothetical protein
MWLVALVLSGEVAIIVTHVWSVECAQTLSLGQSDRLRESVVMLLIQWSMLSVLGGICPFEAEKGH